MSKLQLSSSLCENCGFCCFSCEYLDNDGCSNHEYRSKSRCASFPLLFGQPTLMGHNDFTGKILEPCRFERNKIWFLFKLDKCLIQQNEILFNSLRWIIEDINNEREINWFFVKYNDKELSILIE
ncbi:MAG: hypothetical protein KAS63_07220 [Candidatus Heimdallarchaeota archaeon]|nr:hypothetical protein [Candidatus Heimdallarchaeota archaeon]MCK4955137.1 hypothetical protein [Candidatus Heimdallarchaeota archaeon]